MPTYDFHCLACDIYIEDVQLRIADRDAPLAEPCPSCEAEVGTIERVVAAPFIGDAMQQGRLNLPSSWTDKLAEMKTKHRRNTIKVPSPKTREF